MSKLTEKLVQSYNTVSTLWNSEKNNFNLLENKEILSLANILNGIFVNKTNIEIPRLVVVGSQSSGKSSVLNSIIGMDILPTGTNMVTRVPLQLELIRVSSNIIKAEFGNYENGLWKQQETISISYPDITNSEKNKIIESINKYTRDKAGEQMNISNKPIFLKIYSPDIPNLSFIDLPGLTMVLHR